MSQGQSERPALQVERFIEAVRRYLPLGARECTRIAQLMQSPLGATRETLSAALVALLAQKPEQCQHIRNCFDACLSPQERPGEPEGLLELPPGRPAAPKGLLARLTPSGRAALLLLGILGLLVLGWYLVPKPLEHELPDAGVVTDLAGPGLDLGSFPDAASPSDLAPVPTVMIEEVEPPRITSQKLTPPVQGPWLGLMMVAGMALLLMALGVRLIGLPRALRRLQSHEQQQAAQALERVALARGELLRPAYQVPPVLPLPQAAIEDSATLLGRLVRLAHGDELNVAATIERTIEAGGRLTPIYLPRRLANELVVLIDVERGDHPYLCGFLALVNKWRRLGIPLCCYRYGDAYPYSLDPENGEAPLFLPEVARQHAGAALLVFSRRLRLGLHGEADWLASTKEFVSRAWLDPDPRRPQEREAEAQNAIVLLREAGIYHTPLTKDGVRALAQQLSTEGLGPNEPPWPEKSTPTTQRQRALKLWAGAAALVPDATWDQVQALREHPDLPELSGELTEFWHVQELLEWVRQQPAQRGVDPEGQMRILCLSDTMQDQLIRWVRKQYGGPDRQGSFENRVHRILVDALGAPPAVEAGDPQQSLGRWIWELTRARHLALLHPKQALALLGRFVESGVYGYLRQFLQWELPRQQSEPLFDRATRSELRVLVSELGRVTLRDVVRGNGRLWLRGACVATAVSCVQLLPLWLKIPRLSQELLPQQEQVQEHPGIERVVRVPVQPKAAEKPKPVGVPIPVEVKELPETRERPKLVLIRPGRFQMGSPASEEGRDNDETQHEVKITRAYYLMETEVTQGQYQAVLGQNPAANSKDWLGTECKTAGVGSKLAVHCVNFYDAVKYANALSAKEGLSPCYVGSGEKVSWPQKQACTGYRLPTEAEWEFAARAGKRTQYAGSGSPGEVAWFADNSGSKVHAVKGKRANAWGLYDMSGNVWEWVWDRFQPDYEKLPGTDPVGPSTGSYRVIRGGSWVHVARFVRVANRGHGDPAYRYANQGIRLARSYH